MKTLIKNGTILTTENEYIADVLVVDEKISAIGKNISDDTKKGRYRESNKGVS